MLVKTNEREIRQSPVGIVLLDSSFEPIYYCHQSVKILFYPKKAGKLKPGDKLLPFNIQSHFTGKCTNSEFPRFFLEFFSGKRRYLCWGFSLDLNGKKSLQPKIALLLARNFRGPIFASKVSSEYNLTNREMETVEYLIEGLTSREIASRMNITSSTVKTFLRLVMGKMGVSNRSGIIGKLIKFH